MTLADAEVKVRGKGTPSSSIQDVDGDGLLDIVVHVETAQLQLSETDTEAVLNGTTFDGLAVQGTGGSLQKVCKSHQAAAFDFITTLMPSANC